MAWAGGTATIQVTASLIYSEAITLDSVGIFATPQESPGGSYLNYTVGSDVPEGDTINALPGANPGGGVFEIVSIGAVTVTPDGGGGYTATADIEVAYPALYAPYTHATELPVWPGPLFNVIAYGIQAHGGGYAVALVGGCWGATVNQNATGAPAAYTVVPPYKPFDKDSGEITSTRTGDDWNLQNNTTGDWGAMVAWAWLYASQRPGTAPTDWQRSDETEAAGYVAHYSRTDTNTETLTIDPRSSMLTTVGVSYDETGFRYLSPAHYLAVPGGLANGVHDAHGDLYAVAVDYNDPANSATMPGATARVFNGGMSANAHEQHTFDDPGAGAFHGSNVALCYLHGALYLLQGGGQIITGFREHFQWDIFRSYDAGVTWEALTNGVWTGPYDGGALVPLANGAGWCSAVIRLKDNGYQERDPGDTANDVPAEIHVKVAVVPEVWPEDSEAIVVGELDESALANLAPFSPLSLMVETHDGSSRLWVTDGFSGAWHSIDNGASWTAGDFTAPLPDADFVRIAPLSGGRFIAVSRTGDMAVSYDGMATWNELGGTTWPGGSELGAGIEQLHHAHSGRLALFDGVGAIQISNNEGATWAVN